MPDMIRISTSPAASLWIIEAIRTAVSRLIFWLIPADFFKDASKISEETLLLKFRNIWCATSAPVEVVFTQYGPGR